MMFALERDVFILVVINFPRSLLTIIQTTSRVQHSVFEQRCERTITSRRLFGSSITTPAHTLHIIHQPTKLA